MISTAHISLLFLCALLPVAAFTQQNEQTEILPPPATASISAYGLSEGLPTNCLENVFTDSKGRLWINPCGYNALADGMNFFQYDGKQAVLVDLEPPEQYQRNDSLFWYLIGESSDGFLFGVEVKGRVAFCWHPNTQEQYFFQLREGEEVLTMVGEESGSILLLGLQGDTYRVYRLERGSKNTLSELTLPFDQDIPYEFPAPLYTEDQQAFFFHQQEGLVRLDLDRGEMELHPWATILNEQEQQSFSKAFPRGQSDWKFSPLGNDSLLLYLGPINGFYFLDTDALKARSLVQLNRKLLPFDVPRLSVQMSQDIQGNILIALGDYFTAISGGTKQPFFKVVLLGENGQLYDYDGISDIMTQRASYQQSQYWARHYFSPNFKQQIGGAYDGGLVLLELQPQYGIEAYPFKEGTRAIIPLDSKSLFVVTDGQEFVLNMTNRTYRPYFFTEDAPHLVGLTMPALSSTHVQQDKFWLATSGPLLQMSSSDKSIQTFPVGYEFEKFVFLNPSEVLIFTLEGQLLIYDLKAKTAVPYLHKGVPFQLEGVINELHVSADSLIWVAARNGLWRINLGEGEVKRFDQSDGFIDDNIMCIHEADDGMLWLGTARAGVLQFHPSTGAITQISEVHGLSNNTVVGILVDEEQNRWVSTFNGITVISPQGQVLFDLHESNGLTHDEFNRTSYAKLPDGRMAFGGVEGINIIDPKKVLQVAAQAQKPNLYLTQLKYYNPKTQKDQLHTGSYLLQEPILIPATHRYLNVDFALSDYLDLPQHTYSYRIVPMKLRDSEDRSFLWTDLGPISELNLNNLSVGDWVIQVRGVDHRRKQVAEPLEIPIHVAQFFYRTWWFYGLCALPFLFGGWAWMRRVFTERERLQREVERRTEQIQRDKEVIEQQAQELRSMDETKSRFFTNISHEFRTPLTIINGMAHKINQNPNQWLTKGIGMITRNSTELLNLVNQILDLRKLEAGSLEPKLVQGNIVPFINYISESFHSMGVGKKVQLQFLPETEALLMDYDPEMILRIVSNLLSNAIKFSETGSTVKLRLAQVSTPDNLSSDAAECLLLRVQDQGLGIPAAELPHIFDRFYQVDDSATRQGEGTGIGLSLTRELIRLLGGTIEVQSKEGEGSTFSVCLPIQRTAPPAPQPVSNIDVPRPVTINSEEELITTPAFALGETKPELLIVEDNADVRQYLTICLQAHYQLSYAANGTIGIEKALDEVPDIIISDVMMPQKDGFEVCDTLKQDVRTSHIPIILLTAKSDADSRISGLQRGADAYLAKPFNEEELLVRLEKLLELRKTLQQRYLRMGGELPNDATATAQEDAFIFNIQDVIRQHLSDETFGIAELCRAIGMGRTQLHNKLKALTGQSTSHYIRSIRLHEAKERLANHPQLNITEIAYETGFSSPIYFSKIFAQEMGISPSQFRKNARTEQ